MGNAVVKGNKEELLEASRNQVVINLLRKSFDGEILKGLNIVEGSMFARCSFVGAGLYGSSFKGCTFVKCDFTNANIYGLTFSGCSFNECKFDEVSFNMTNFINECVINNCSFNGVNLSDANGVTGIDPNDLNVVAEQTDLMEIPILLELGFTQTPDGCYEFKADDELSKIAICYDSEYEYYRNMIFINESIDLQTTDIIDINEMPKASLIDRIVNDLKLAIKRFSVKMIAEIENGEEVLNSLNSLLDKFINTKNENNANK